MFEALVPVVRPSGWHPDWRLMTAEVLYGMPDHPAVLQTFIWQKHDLAPEFPELARFLDFWRREIEGPLHSVRVASEALIRPAELRYSNGVFTLH
ncbi:usg protein [Roseococcus pinisoli]|uniref:Usg-like family protein n=1 Tax=Roseococcus pinisoli TaxID=2835040 RepID=A0ABS5Q834_9PROT|nr:Usg-like family protein [Roseococcus pinisoli]MBS7809826.1 Usg-like family protein [Roseococcus pinisoli]